MALERANISSCRLKNKDNLVQGWMSLETRINLGVHLSEKW